MKYAAELFGTFVLVFAGLGTAVLAGSVVGNVGVALAFGLVLVAMVYTVGPISGAHLNPAVTLAVLLSRRIRGGQAAGYWVSQIIGAIIAAGLVLLIASGAPGGYSASANGLAATGYDLHSPGHYNMASAMLAEVFLTMLLAITVLGATDDNAPAGFAGIPIGLVLASIILAGIPVTNGSFNPARSIGPAVYVGGWALQQLWLFIVGPLIGGALAALIYGAIRRPGAPITTRQAEQALPSEQMERRTR